MLKLFFKSLFILPIFALMMYVSYTVDPSGLFWGVGFERLASEYMLEGHYIDGYERLDGRKLNEVYAKNVPYSPEVIINGSSRSMMVTHDINPDGTFYNTGNIGADYFDFYTSYYIFAKEGKEPQIMILSIDPWQFNADAQDTRSDKELYYEFLGTELNIVTENYIKPADPNEKYFALLDPAYFQSSVEYYYRDTEGEVAPEIVPIEEIYLSDVVIKAPDGSIIYDISFRERAQEIADHDAFATTTYGLMRAYDFVDISDENIMIFETFVEYLQNKGIEVVLFLPPLHPIMYESMASQPQHYQGSLDTETYIINFANENGITLYGSYDPNKLNLTNEDFYDALHIRAESVQKILPNTF